MQSFVTVDAVLHVLLGGISLVSPGKTLFFQLVMRIFSLSYSGCSSLPFLSLLKGKEIHLQKEMQSIPPFLKEAV